MEAAEGERELGMEIKRGTGQAAARNRELCGEKKLQGELGFSGAALGHDFRYTIARNAAVKEAIKNGAAKCEFRGLGWERAAEEIFWFHGFWFQL